ncbi:MAG: hypothetical protein KatS3mg057_1551 [Herpetosiphonaceae bacterium]|nr:MAG: hypothetical protein KatS3mg057_1551 [Herpetosiphonaceae bacterium]
MGQRADEMRQPQERDQSPEEIRDNIEHTRAEMSETIDAIQERLSPAYLKEQVKDQVRETFHETRTAAVENVKGAGSTMLETIKRNPIPAAIAGVKHWLAVAQGDE